MSSAIVKYSSCIVLWFSGHDVDNVVANVILGVIAEIKINNCFFINVIPTVQFERLPNNDCVNALV